MASHRGRAAPLPILRVRHQARSQWIPLDIPAEDQEVPVTLHGDRLESALVDGTPALASVCPPPALRVGACQPMHETREAVVGFGPDDEVPVIRHDAVGEDSHPEAHGCLGDESEEVTVIVGRMEDDRVLDGAVENVKDESSRRAARASGHRLLPSRHVFDLQAGCPRGGITDSLGIRAEGGRMGGRKAGRGGNC